MGDSLFEPIRMGSIACPNRVLMAPLTRARGTRDFLPRPLMQTYYAQRASAGLILSEAIGINADGLGWPNATGLWNQQQIDGWAAIVEAVHAAGGRILAQLWHIGRQVHPSFLDGRRPLAPSAIRAAGTAHTYEGKQDRVVPREMTADDIAVTLDAYGRAASNAIAAGFDGVQLHAANGYLVDQFLHDGSNTRTDGYGGSADNRCRFMIEATQRLIDAAGADRTTLRLSPSANMGDVDDSDVAGLFDTAVRLLDPLGLAFLELHEPGTGSSFHAGRNEPLADKLRQVYGGVLVLNSDYTPDAARDAIVAGHADAISFGRAFIANPDLPQRISSGTALAESDKSTWYANGVEGFTDYPTAGD